MKRLIIFFAFTISFSSLAQQGINYKALIKDGSGNVLASSPISIQFIIYEGVALTNNVYQESHTVNTDANGFVIVNIGKGVTSDVFTAINWGADQHFLNVQVNTGSGLVDMGTTEFMAVPYAKHAETATTAANVTGLEKITENFQTGWRLIGQDPANYGDIGISATDLSYSDSPSAVRGATGDYSTAIGGDTKASGDFSTSMGFLSQAEAFASTAIGFSNIGGGNPTSWVDTDPLFEIGNGNIFALSNALTILKNGTITAPSFDLSEITDNKALITKEYADTNLGSSGLETLDEGNGVGWRLKNSNPNNFGNVGINAVDLSISEATSSTNGAIGENSIALGSNTKADSYKTTTIGANNIGGGNPTMWIETDPLFEIGNSNTATPSNALTVLKNGNVAIGNNTPSQKLEVNGKIKISNDNQVATAGAMRFNNVSNNFEGYNGSEWISMNYEPSVYSYEQDPINESYSSTNRDVLQAFPYTLTIEKPGKYMCLFDITFFGLHGNTTTLTSDRSLLVEFQVYNQVATKGLGPNIVALPAGYTFYFRQYENIQLHRIIDIPVANQNMEIRFKVNKNPCCVASTVPYYLLNVKMTAIKLN